MKHPASQLDSISQQNYRRYIYHVKPKKETQHWATYNAFVGLTPHYQMFAQPTLFVM